MRDDTMPYPWPDQIPQPTEPYRSKAERKALRYVGPTGGILTNPAAIAKRRAAQNAQRAARRKGRG